MLGCLLLQTIMVFAQPQEKTATVAFTGDIMMGTTFPSTQLPPQQGRQLFVDAAPVLQRVDLAFGNLEGTLCDGGKSRKVVSSKCYAFRTPTSFSPRLKEAGYDFLSMANNHAFDFGLEGVKSTIKCLDAQHIKHAGVKDFPEYAIIEHNGLKYGVCAFGHNEYTFRHQNLDLVRRIITDLANQTDIVIVSFHGGAEGAKRNRLPYGREIFLGEDRGDLRHFAHFCIDAGADVVYGHGPHVVRAVELYKEHFIAYSLGNFCTPYGINVSGISGYAPILELKLTEDGRFVNGQIHSFIQYRGKGPRKDSQHRVAREIRRLTKLDMPGVKLQISDTGAITHL